MGPLEPVMFDLMTSDYKVWERERGEGGRVGGWEGGGGNRELWGKGEGGGVGIIKNVILSPKVHASPQF